MAALETRLGIPGCASGPSLLLVSTWSPPKARPPVIRFAGYRQFDAARSEANDAMAALLIGSRLATHLLAANVGSSATLPVIYPAVPGVDRLNRSVSDASRLLADAEDHLAAMAIPYVQATYEVYISSTIPLLQSSGYRPPTSSEKRRGIMGLHAYLTAVTGLSLPGSDLALLDVVRQVRNAIVHDGSKVTTGLISAWTRLPGSAVARWMKTAGRPLDITGPRISLSNGELVISLAIAKSMAREVAYIMGTAVSQTTWAALIVDDFLSHYEKRIPADGIRLRRKVHGWARIYYGPAGVAPVLIENELLTRGL